MSQKLLSYLAKSLGAEPVQDGAHYCFPCPRSGCHKKTPHFGVRITAKGAVGHCVKCGWPEKGSHLDIYSVLAQLEGVPRYKIIQKVKVGDDSTVDNSALLEFLKPKVKKEQAELEDSDFETNESSREDSDVLSPIAPHEEAFDDWNYTFLSILKPRTELGRKIKDYLYGRDIGVELIKNYHLRYCDKKLVAGPKNVGKRFHGRLMIPVLHRGRIVYFQGRTIDPKDPQKYKNPVTGFDFKIGAIDTMFGLDPARGKKEVILVEGPMDAIKLGDGAIAMMGKGLTPARCRMLQDNGHEKAILFFDKDLPLKERQSMIELLSQYMSVRWTVSRSQNKDAAAMTGPEQRATLELARPMTFLEKLGLAKME